MGESSLAAIPLPPFEEELTEDDAAVAPAPDLIVSARLSS
jgi:hypothetical protein